MMASARKVVFLPAQVRTRKGRTLQVREYTFEDYGTLAEMYRGFEPKRVAQGLPPPDVPRIARWLNGLHNISHALLACDGKRGVAHTILCPIRTDRVEFTVFVHQDYREEGLGTALSRLTLIWATEMGFLQVFLTTELSNFPAMQLFRKLGFQVTTSFGDECEMMLDLAKGLATQPQAA
jgi:GNAT superfamily N-acetyltransferase